MEKSKSLKTDSTVSSDSAMPLYFLKALKEDGIEEVYVDPAVEVNSSHQPSALAGCRLREPASDSESLSESQPKEAGNSRKDQILNLRSDVLKCKLCDELAATRKTVVFGSGNIRAQLMFVGEAPGFDEDVQGLPFVGKAGQLLTKIIESIQLSRKDVFIANVLKCRPPENRAPRPDEVLNCQAYLMKQIELIQPRVICALGNFAAQTLLKTGNAISKLRGQFYDFPNFIRADGEAIKVICTFHPAYLLRNPEEKRKVWEDMKMIRKALQDRQESPDANPL